MIISRTPFRISFFGGGTDYPAWYQQNGGAVLSTTIDKYCYVSCRVLPPFFEHRIRVVYSKAECCQHYSQIQHPAVRETLRFLGLDHGLEIHHDGDLPARSGMGSSSSFTVGLLHALYAHMGVMPSKMKLATESIYIEQEMIKETVGCQDQVCVAHGGLNQINFSREGHVNIQPIVLPAERLEQLNAHLMLFYTGIKRTASAVAKEYVNGINTRSVLLSKMRSMVDQAVDILTSTCDLAHFGELLHQTWMLKRSLAPGVSNSSVDDIYSRAMDAGALGGKIMGAGGGGFLLLFVPPEKQPAVRQVLSNRIHVPFRFESSGSQIIFYAPEQQDYAELDRSRANRKIEPFVELDTLVKPLPIAQTTSGSRVEKGVAKVV